MWWFLQDVDTSFRLLYNQADRDYANIFSGITGN